MNQLVNEAFVLAYSHQIRGVLTRAKLKGLKDSYIDELTVLARLVDLCLVTSDDLQSTKVALSELIQDVKDSFSDTNERIIFEQDTNRSIRGDKELLNHALREVVKNALEYSNGQVIISVHIYKKGLVVRVEDQGQGMSEREKEQVFEPFFRGKSASKASNVGVGLGLASGRAIALAHKGDIIIAESSAKGTTMLIALNIAQDGDFSADSIKSIG